MTSCSASACSLLTAVALVVALASPARALAQTAEAKAQAEALYDEGLALRDKGQCPEAIAKLEASQELDPNPSTAFFLAECLAQTGRVVSAWGRFRESAQLARRLNLGPQASRAEARAGELEARLPRLRLATDTTAQPSELAVTVGGRAINKLALGSALPFDPGPIEVRAEAPGHVAWSQTVELREAATVEVLIPPLIPAPAPAEPPPPPPATQPAAPTAPATPTAPAAAAPVAPAPPAAPVRVARSRADRVRVQRLVGHGTIAAGALAAMAGGYFAVEAAGARRAAAHRCDGLEVCDAEGDRLLAEAASDRSRALWLIGTGVMAMAGGLVLEALVPDLFDGDEAVQVGAASDGASVSAFVGGRF